jgi:hypothetical protein
MNTGVPEHSKTNSPGTGKNTFALKYGLHIKLEQT